MNRDENGEADGMSLEVDTHTNEQRDRIAVSISRVDIAVLTRDKNLAYIEVALVRSVDLIIFREFF